MISYKYKIYRTCKTKHIENMLKEACFVWNHALALQKRYYRIYGKYINRNKLKKHFAKRINRNLLHSQTSQEILERLDLSYQKFFRHQAKRPPKYKKYNDFSTIVFKQGGYVINGNTITINRINKTFKFSLSRTYEGNIKTLIIHKNKVGEFFIVMVLDNVYNTIGKTHNGASVGIDFGLKKYLTLSDGTTYDNPQFLKKNLIELRRRSRNISKCKKDSNNRERNRIELNRLMDYITNSRSDFQWKLANELCSKYDRIFIEDLNIIGMNKRWGRKMRDIAHTDFVRRLEYVAKKYGVIVHKIDRYYPSSKTCTCGYINKELKLSDRMWVCPECGETHNRDVLAANNILRRGIYELESSNKTSKHTDKKRLCLNPTIS